MNSIWPVRVQEHVLGADRRIVEPGGHGVGADDLALLVLEHQGAGAVEHAQSAAREPRRVIAQVRPPAAGLDADQQHVRPVEERGE